MAVSQSPNPLLITLSLLFVAALCHPIPASAQAQPASPPEAQTESQQPPADKPPQPGQTEQTAPLPPKEEPGVKAPGKTPEGEDKRILGVLPNYRTAEMSAIGHPLTAPQKLHIAVKDSFDYPLIFVGAGYAGLYQLENSHPEFGQGLKGYFRRFGTSYADQVIGNMMTEGFMPVLLKEDPRYFRMAEGSKSRRLWYAVSRIVITRTDSGAKTF